MQTQQQRNGLGRWVWSAATALIILALGYVVLRQLDWAEIYRAISQADFKWAVIAASSIILGQTVRLWRAWRLMQRGGTLAWGDVVRATLGAQVINWLSPLRVGDVWRIWQLRQQQHAGVIWSALAILVEKSLDSVVLALIALTLLLLPTPPNINSTLIRLAMVACAGALLLSVLLVLRPGMLQRQLAGRFPVLVEWGLRWPETNAHETLFPPREIVLAAFASALMWGLAALTNIALAQAFHIAWAGWMIPLLIVSIQTVSIVSPIPGNIGVIPLVTIGVLALGGVPTALGMAHGTLHYLLVYGINLVWFLLMQLGNRDRLTL